VYSDLAGSGNKKRSLCQGRKNECSRKRKRKKNYLQLTERRKANFNKVFELVARISCGCDLKEDWQLSYQNRHNGKVFQCRGEIGNGVRTIQAASKAASNKGLKLERIILGMETRAF